jgi:hypothetical protein
MPRMDGTGPSGKGPGTGRRMGRCKKNLNDNNIPGRGRSQGKLRKTGAGKGRGKQTQKDILK